MAKSDVALTGRLPVRIRLRQKSGMGVIAQVNDSGVSPRSGRIDTDKCQMLQTWCRFVRGIRNVRYSGVTRFRSWLII